MTRYALVTFDVYSALFDIAGSLTPPLRRLSGLGEAEAAAAFALWRAKQLERAAISTALEETIRAHGEDAALDLVESLRERILCGEFTPDRIVQ